MLGIGRTSDFKIALIFIKILRWNRDLKKYKFSSCANEIRITQFTVRHSKRTIMKERREKRKRRKQQAQEAKRDENVYSIYCCQCSLSAHTPNEISLIESPNKCWKSVESKVPLWSYLKKLLCDCFWSVTFSMTSLIVSVLGDLKRVSFNHFLPKFTDEGSRKGINWNVAKN